MTAAAQPPSETLIASLRDRHTTWMTVIPTMLAAADAIERLERDLAAAKARVVELEERVTEDTAAGRLIDAWCAEKGTKIPWSKAVQIVAIVTKQSDAERDRLLRLGDEDGSCGMCGRSDAERDLAQATIARQAEELERVRKDSERYRWLRNDALMKLQSGPICVAADKWGNPLTQHPEDDPGLGPALHITLDGKELDAAIDSAIAKERS